jgi:hypothetical protein
VPEDQQKQYRHTEQGINNKEISAELVIMVILVPVFYFNGAGIEFGSWWLSFLQHFTASVLTAED